MLISNTGKLDHKDPKLLELKQFETISDVNVLTVDLA